MKSGQFNRGCETPGTGTRVLNAPVSRPRLSDEIRIVITLSPSGVTMFENAAVRGLEQFEGTTVRGPGPGAIAPVSRPTQLVV